MKKNKKAVTLSELLIALSMIAVITAILAPTLSKTSINNDKAKIRRVYAQVLSVVRNMVADANLYPDASGFQNCATYIEPSTNQPYGGEQKFADIFISQLNIAQDNLTNIPSPNQNNPQNKNRLGVANTNIDKTTNQRCVLTTDGITYCIPFNTCTSNRDTMFIDGTTQYLPVITIYLDQNYDPKRAYYVTVDNVGKVSIPHAKRIFASTSITCTRDKHYDTYNQCKFKDYMRDTNI